MIYSFLFQPYHVSATIQNVCPVIMYAWKLIRAYNRSNQNGKDQIMAVTEVNRLIRRETLDVLLSQLIELRLDQNPRSTLSIPPSRLKSVEIVRGATTSHSILSLFDLPALNKVTVYRPDITVRSELLFESFLYVKGRVEQSWVTDTRYLCSPGTLLHEVYYDERRRYNLSYHCDVTWHNMGSQDLLRLVKRKASVHFAQSASIANETTSSRYSTCRRVTWSS